MDGDAFDPRSEATWPERIVVGTDTSSESITALQCALALAMRAGSTVVAVHAVGPAESRSATPDIDQLVRQACIRVGCPNVLIGRSIFEAGPPAETLLRVAERVGGDLLVIGRRGLGTAASSLGSTSEAVLDAADIPVLIVPRVCSPVEITSATLSGSAACPSARSVGLVE